MTEETSIEENQIEESSTKESLIAKTFKTSRGNICYWVNQLKKDTATLVFLPGLTADHQLFEQQLGFFAAQYNVLTWDAPGHGASRPFKLDFSLLEKAAWLHDILACEQITAPVLIGQSMGGYVSQCFIQRYPGEAAGFISIDSASLQRKYMTAAEIWALRRCEPIYRLYPWQSLVKSGTKGCAVTEYGQSLMKKMMYSYTPKEYSVLAGHGYRMLADAVAADLPYKIDCPALLLCGEYDRAGSTKRYNRRWTQESGLPLSWIKNAGHNSNTDNPQQVNSAIQEFLRENNLV